MDPLSSFDPIRDDLVREANEVWEATQFDHDLEIAVMKHGFATRGAAMEKKWLAKDLEFRKGAIPLSLPIVAMLILAPLTGEWWLLFPTVAFGSIIGWMMYQIQRDIRDHRKRLAEHDRDRLLWARAIRQAAERTNGHISRVANVN